MVEIAKGFRSGKKIYILDEPTASLADRETHNLFELMRAVKEKGLSVVFVSHRLNEVLSICDEVTVLKDGESVGVFKTAQLDMHGLARHMSSAKIADNLISSTHKARSDQLRGTPYIEFSKFTRKKYFRELTLDLYKGEVLGVGGLQGVGRSEFFRSAIGIDEKDLGEVYFEGRRIQIGSPLDALVYGIVYVTEDRRQEGLFYNQNITFNTSISSLKALISKVGVINLEAERTSVDKFIRNLNIRVSGVDQLALTLSGGNQQKIVLARWLMAQARVIIFDEPTVGIDIGAKEEMYNIIAELAQTNKAIVAICTEVSELLRLSDRIVVLRKDGTFSDIVNVANVDESGIREMMVV